MSERPLLMRNVLLALFLLQVSLQNPGFVTGIVRTAAGAPAAAVRVYAVTARAAAEALNSPPALESLIETDSSGRYRLELPAGRYYIASGSVASPTYYPGTSDVSAARVVTVVSGTTVESIDFGSFVPASRSGRPPVFVPPPRMGGELSGVIRYSDGTPAVSIFVLAVQAVAPSSPSRSFVAVSDSTGRYRISNIPADNYYIAAGFSDSPSFYPGTTDVAAAKTITTTTTTKVDTLDFVLSRPPEGPVVSGRVTSASGSSLNGAFVRMKAQPIPTSIVPGLPLRSAYRDVALGVDGLFESRDVPAGPYTVEVSFPGVPTQTRSITVSNLPISDLQFILPLATVSGRILMEDGDPFPDPRIIEYASVLPGANTMSMQRATLPISDKGTFQRQVAGGVYLFRVRTMPAEYELRSIVSGASNLMKDPLTVIAGVPVDVEIRIGRRASIADPSLVKVSGTAVSAFDGQPSDAQRVMLCCFALGPVEQLSVPLRPDGSFDFADVPPGKYTPSLLSKPGQPSLFAAGSFPIAVGNQDVTGVQILSSSQVGRLVAMVFSENSTPLPPSVRPSVFFAPASGLARVEAQRSATGVYSAQLPVGGPYAVSVTNVPEGYEVKNITGPFDVKAPNFKPSPPVVAIIVGRVP